MWITNYRGLLTHEPSTSQNPCSGLCKAGWIKPESSASCVRCPEGKVSKTGQPYCHVCSPGLLPSPDGSACIFGMYEFFLWLTVI